MRSLVTRTAIALTVIAGVTLSAAHAQQPSELEDARREIKQLRSQVQALRAALSEAAELDYKRAAALSRALNAIPTQIDSSSPRTRDDGDKGRPAPAPVAAAPAAPPPPPPAAPAPAPAHARRGAEGGKRAAAPEPAATAPTASSSTVEGGLSGLPQRRRGQTLAAAPKPPPPPAPSPAPARADAGAKFSAFHAAGRGTRPSAPSEDSR